MNDIKITYTVYSKYPNPDDMIAELEARLARLEEAGDRLLVHHVFDDDNNMYEAHCIYCGAPGKFNRESLEWEIDHSPDCPVTAWQRAKEGKE